MKQVVPVSAQYAMCVGMWATVVVIFEELAEYNQVEGPIKKLETSLTSLIINWRFLPTLLIVFKVNSHISRWVNWLGNAGGIVGRMGDLALIIGSLEDINSPDLKKRDRARKLQFRFYRYLNTAHVLSYFGLDHRIGEDPEALVNELAHLGLIEEEEKIPLLQTVGDGIGHTTVLTWLAIVWHSQIEFHQGEGDNHPNSTNFMQKLMDLRGQIGCVRCELDFSDPEITRGMMYMVTYLLLFFVMLGLPLQFYVKEQCFQWQCVLVSVSEILMYHGLLVMQDILARSPFDVMGEVVNMDNLLCEGEEMIFRMIRCGYDPSQGRDASKQPAIETRRKSSLYAHPIERVAADDEFSPVLPNLQDNSELNGDDTGTFLANTPYAVVPSTPLSAESPPMPGGTPMSLESTSFVPSSLFEKNPKNPDTVIECS
jgi:hypothetical protein